MCGWQPLVIERETREEGLKKEQVHEDQGDKINAGWTHWLEKKSQTWPITEFGSDKDQNQMEGKGDVTLTGWIVIPRWSWYWTAGVFNFVSKVLFIKIAIHL